MDKKKLFLIVFVLIVSLNVVSCSSKSSAPVKDHKNAFTIGSGSENALIWSEIIEPWCREHSYECLFLKKGSVDLSNATRVDKADDIPFDAIWPAHSMWIDLGNRSYVTNAESIFKSPVVPALPLPLAEKLGLVGKQGLTFGDIVELVGSGKVDAWMTNPTQSNSGAGTYFALLNHCAGNASGVPLSMEQLNDAGLQTCVQTYLNQIDKSSESTGFLKDTCLANYEQCPLIFIYESLVIEANQELLKENKPPLYALYPNGLPVSDSPLGFIDHNNPEKEKIFTALQEYLLSDAVQARILALGRRTHGVGLTLENPDPKVFNPDWGINPSLIIEPVTFPNREVLQEALLRYANQWRKGSFTVYCLDSSGSMSGDPWAALVNATSEIFDQEKATKNYLQAGTNDTTYVMTFNAQVNAGPWQVDGNNAKDLLALQEHIASHDTGGGTNMYTCLERAYQIAQNANSANRFPAVILMTDGKSNTGGAERFFEAAASTKTPVPVFAITFGDADESQLQEVARATWGAVLDGKSDLIEAFKKAKGNN